MGLFSFFKNKKEEAPAPQGTEVKCELTKVQRTISPANLEGVDKVRPNCYGNYLFPPEASYIVRGLNTVTNRKNKKTYTASSEADAIRQAEAAGLAGPFEVECIPAGGPTERQLAYAADLGLTIPDGACSSDVSALLSRVEGNDDRAALPEVLEFLAGRGWRGSSLIGYDAMLVTVMDILTEPRDRIAFYAYYIDQAENKRPLANFDKAPRKDHYIAFADHGIHSEKTTEHFERWRVDRGWSTAKTWGIYKDYKEYCAVKR